MQKITPGDLVVRYRDAIVPRKKGAEIETIILDAFLRHPMCQKPLKNISTLDFAQYRDARLTEVKPSTLKRQLAPLQNMFEVARDEWGIPLKENPLDKLTLKAPDIRRERRLREGELERLLSSARTRKNPYIEKVIVFAIETAMRREEILALVGNKWLRQYNHVRPHRALNMRPPVPETVSKSGPQLGG